MCAATRLCRKPCKQYSPGKIDATRTRTAYPSLAPRGARRFFAPAACIGRQNGR